jgi:hypothetical protein
MRSRTWSGSPYRIDVAVVYPVDSLNSQLGSSCVKDVLLKEPKKVLLVSKWDQADLSWIDNYSPVRVVFDTTEERPAYHE